MRGKRPSATGLSRTLGAKLTTGKIPYGHRRSGGSTAFSAPKKGHRLSSWTVSLRAVGLVFDGNIHSPGGRYAYVPATNRAVVVHGEGLLTALEHVYGAQRLVQELRAAQAR